MKLNKNSIFVFVNIKPDILSHVQLYKGCESAGQSRTKIGAEARTAE
jgi:hypothetical protein